jgi:predicted transposase YbfD/YdcC
MPSLDLKELFTPYFGNLTDPRVSRTRRHTLLDLVVLALCATLGGADGWADIERFGKAKLAFFRTFLELPNGIPSHDTFGRVFARLDPAALLSCVRAWLMAFAATCEHERVAIDGKTLRGSFDTAAGRGPLHLVSAWAAEARLVLGQVAVDAKSNEITAIPLLLELLDLEGCVVTVDAMGCQREIAQALRRQGADYVLGLKGNQGTLADDVTAFFIDCLDRDFAGVPHRSLKTADRAHGRQEVRHYYVVPVPAAIQARHGWPGLKSLGMVYAERQVGDGEPTGETRFFLSSLPPKVREFARAVRGHWEIENRLHWSLDVTFAEDRSRVRRDHGPTNLGMFRRLALSILQQDTSSKDTLRGKRLSAGWDEDRLLTILTGFCGK